MARPTAEERRRDYLEVGAELAAEFDAAKAADGPIDALANIRVADVARRAGVTKGALYHIWDSQEDYRRDLLAHLLEVERQAGFDDIRQVLDTVEPGTDDAEVMDRMAQFSYDRLKDDPACFARFSYIAYAAHPEIRALLSPGNRDFIEYYEGYLRANGRRMRPPYTIDMLRTITEGWLFGCLLRHRTSPELIEGPLVTDGGARSLYTLGLRALMESFTEPDPEADGPA
jgi:AcrR family transcriptional regulator